jgi:hypothetical protein
MGRITEHDNHVLEAVGGGECYWGVEALVPLECARSFCWGGSTEEGGALASVE